MPLVAERPEFAPPPQRGTPSAVLLALIAHALLIAALTWGVNWRREAEDDAVEAELWSSTVQQAAPRFTPPPVPTPPAPAPTPAPPPPPPPPQAVKPPEPTPAPRAPDIALEREKKLKEQQALQRELEEQQAQQKKLEAARKAAQDKKEQEARQRAEEEAERKKEQQQKLADAKKKQQEAEAKQAAADAAAKKKEADAKAAADKVAAEKARQDNIRRMLGQASATGEQNSGPRSGKGAGTGISAGYFGRVAALIKRNVIFDPESVSGNPEAEIQIQTSPDGTIVGTPRLVKSSGNPAWDEAAMRAVQKTEVMPRDVDGRVPSPFPLISLRPKQ